tara:strand:+ start:1255 stop:1683 length:429 start_codon:yes stop_codon:yes gene_type:complete
MPILEGKLCEWASVKTPNTTFTPEYQITLIIDDKTADDFISRGFRVKDVDGVKKIMIKRKVDRKDGTPNAVPKLLDINKEPLDISVGNGSKVNVQYREWETTNQYGDFKGLDLQAVQVVDLVEYTGSDGSELESLEDDNLEF